MTTPTHRTQDVATEIGWVNAQIEVDDFIPIPFIKGGSAPGTARDFDQAVDNLSAALKAAGSHPSQTNPAPLWENGSSYIHFSYQKRTTQPELPGVSVVALDYRRHYPDELNPVLDLAGDDAGGQRKAARYLARFKKALRIAR